MSSDVSLLRAVCVRVRGSQAENQRGKIQLYDLISYRRGSN